MKVSKSWLKELVDIKDMDEVVRLLPLRTIAIKADAPEYIELDMKGYNRADLLSLRGVAYEVAAILESQVKFTEDESDRGDILSQNKDLKVEVTNSEICPLYSLVKIEGLKVAPSPKEWVEKLEASGMRSVNNLADITNLIMLEFGQPLHAFDAKAVKDETIVVRTAHQGERITTLDGKTRDLEPNDLLISDPQNNLGIAGVMGGKDSEVSETTETILLEAAIFNAKKLRATSTRLGLVSEASKRFYHGLTQKRLYQALNSAIKMYQELGGKVTGVFIEDHLEEELPTISLTKQKTDSLIGVEIPKEEIEGYLMRLNFHLGGEAKDSPSTPLPGVAWQVTPPYWRLDIAIEEDLIEEVARMYGYEKIPAKELKGEHPPRVDQSIFELIKKLKDTLVDLGLTEVQTYSFASTAVLKNPGWMEEDNLKYSVKVENPISSETEYLRQHLWSNLVEVISKNLKYRYEDMAVFEVGKAYYPTQEGPKESYRLSIALMNKSDNPISELYAIFNALRQRLNLNIKDGDSTKEPFGDKLFHPTRYLNLMKGDQQAGGIAEVHPKILHKFGIEKRVAVVELDLTALL